MNKQIQLVEEWLADNDSVSQLELEANAADANAAYTAAKAAANASFYAANASFYAVNASFYAVNAAYFDAAHGANANAANVAARWVAKYHKLVKEPTL